MSKNCFKILLKVIWWRQDYCELMPRIRIRSTPKHQKEITSGSQSEASKSRPESLSLALWVPVIGLTMFCFWFLCHFTSPSANIRQSVAESSTILSKLSRFGQMFIKSDVVVTNVLPNPVEIDQIAEKDMYVGKIMGTFLKEINPVVKNLVLGLAANVDPKYFAIFCGSLRDVSSSIEAVVFINAPVSERHLEIAKRKNVVVVEYNIADLPVDYRGYHPSTLRWILFYRLLARNSMELQRRYQNVLFVDVRDTYFQRDPFPLLPANRSVFYAFAENSGQTIMACGWNSKWVSDCFGPMMLELIGNLPIICSGVSLASMDRAYEYVELMTDIFSGNGLMGKGFPTCERNGVDQGAHNVLIHLGLLNSQSIMYESLFPITHMQSSTMGQVLDPVNAPQLVHIGTEIAAVVHQYDRNGLLQQALAKKYIYWVNIDDKEALWRDEPHCQAYQSVQGVDLFVGRCDFGSLRTISFSSCCVACDEKNENGKTCSAFAYSDGVCYFKSCNSQEVALITQSYVKPAFEIGGVPLMSAYKLAK